MSWPSPPGSSGSGGGSGSAGTSYLGLVATTTALTALAASLGCTALVGASEAAAYLYELKAADGTIEANWQALQAIMAGGSQYAVELVAGKYWRRALLYVPIGNQVTVTIGGVTQPLLLGSAQPHVIDIYDEPGVAWPTSITFQRTSGSDATGWFSVLG